ncbi:MAG: winged helix DNA-binding domain-containing protein [Actinomycetota bacterium]|nr:winged helix DNA-binding domain-containing protein [Actinomycetota bacterium]
MKPQEIARWRMRQQRLWNSDLNTPEQALGWLGAVQAQEFAFAKWTLAQRTRNPDLGAIDKAFVDGTILRTHILRPTWHFVQAEDIRWMLAVSAPRVHQRSATQYRALGIDDIYPKTNKLIAKALKGGNHLTRKEIRGILEKSGFTGSGQWLGYVVFRAELDGLVCSGAMKGKQHTYALLDERVPQAVELDEEEALVELARRYFTSWGPATAKDFATWASLTLAQVKRGITALGDALHQEVVDDRTYWFGSRASGAKPNSPRVGLVQVYDEIVMSYSQSRDALQGEHTAVFPQGADPHLVHPLLLDGRLIGHWRRTNNKESVEIHMRLYDDLNNKESSALKKAVDRFQQFLGIQVIFKT